MGCSAGFRGCFGCLLFVPQGRRVAGCFGGGSWENVL